MHPSKVVATRAVPMSAAPNVAECLYCACSHMYPSAHKVQRQITPTMRNCAQ